MKNLYCPKCKVLLTKVYQHNIETHVCFSCKGKWIDDASVKEAISNLRYVGVSECEHLTCPICEKILVSKTFLTSTASFKAAQCQSCKSIWIKFKVFNDFINLVKMPKAKSELKSRNTFKLKSRCPRCGKLVENNYCSTCKIKFKIDIETESKKFNWAIPGCIFSIVALIACLKFPIIIVPIIIFVVLPGYIFSKKNETVTTEITKFTDMEKCFACGTNIPQTDDKCPKCFARFNNKLNKEINQIDIILHEIDKDVFKSLLEQEKIEKLREAYGNRRRELVNKLTGYQEIEERILKKEIMAEPKEILLKDKIDNKSVEKQIEEEVKAKLAKDLEEEIETVEPLKIEIENKAEEKISTAKQEDTKKLEGLPGKSIEKLDTVKPDDQKEVESLDLEEETPVKLEDLSAEKIEEVVKAEYQDQEKEEFFRIKEAEQEESRIKEMSAKKEETSVQESEHLEKGAKKFETKAAEEDAELFEPDFKLEASMSEPMLPEHDDKKGEKSEQDIAVEEASGWVTFLQAFLNEKNIRWLSTIGAISVIISSIVLVVKHWEFFPNSIRYIVLLAYTACFYGTSILVNTKLNLKKTGETFLVITAFIVPLNFIYMSRLGLTATIQGGALFTFGFAILSYFTYFTLKNFVGKVSVSYVINFMLLCASIIAFDFFTKCRNVPLNIFIGIALWFNLFWCIVNTNKFYSLVDMLDQKRVTLFIPSLIIYLYLLITIPILRLYNWYGPLVMFISIPLIEISHQIIKVRQKKESDEKKLPLSLLIPMLAGYGLSIFAYILSFISIYHLICTAFFGLLLYWKSAKITRKKIFAYLSILSTGILYYFIPVAFKESLFGFVQEINGRLGYKKLPFAFHGVTFIPFNLLLIGIALSFKKKQNSLFKAYMHIALPLSIFLVAISCFEIKALLATSFVFTGLYFLSVIFLRERLLVYNTVTCLGLLCFSIVKLIKLPDSTISIIFSILALIILSIGVSLKEAVFTKLHTKATRAVIKKIAEFNPFIITASLLSTTALVFQLMHVHDCILNSVKVISPSLFIIAISTIINYAYLSYTIKHPIFTYINVLFSNIAVFSLIFLIFGSNLPISIAGISLFTLVCFFTAKKILAKCNLGAFYLARQNIKDESKLIVRVYVAPIYYMTLAISFGVVGIAFALKVSLYAIPITFFFFCMALEFNLSLLSYMGFLLLSSIYFVNLRSYYKITTVKGLEILAFYPLLIWILSWRVITYIMGLKSSIKCLAEPIYKTTLMFSVIAMEFGWKNPYITLPLSVYFWSLIKMPFLIYMAIISTSLGIYFGALKQFTYSISAISLSFIWIISGQLLFLVKDKIKYLASKTKKELLTPFALFILIFTLVSLQFLFAHKELPAIRSLSESSIIALCGIALLFCHILYKTKEWIFVSMVLITLAACYAIIHFPKHLHSFAFTVLGIVFLLATQFIAKTIIKLAQLEENYIYPIYRIIFGLFILSLYNYIKKLYEFDLVLEPLDNLFTTLGLTTFIFLTVFIFNKVYLSYFGIVVFIFGLCVGVVKPFLPRETCFLAATAITILIGITGKLLERVKSVKAFKAFYNFSLLAFIMLALASIALVLPRHLGNYSFQNFVGSFITYSSFCLYLSIGAFLTAVSLSFYTKIYKNSIIPYISMITFTNVLIYISLVFTSSLNENIGTSGVYGIALLCSAIFWAIMHMFATRVKLINNMFTNFWGTEIKNDIAFLVSDQSLDALKSEFVNFLVISFLLVITAVPLFLQPFSYLNSGLLFITGLLFIYYFVALKIKLLPFVAFTFFSAGFGYAYYVMFANVDYLAISLAFLWLICGVIFSKNYAVPSNIFSFLFTTASLYFAVLPVNMLSFSQFFAIASIYFYIGTKYKVIPLIQFSFTLFTLSTGYIYYSYFNTMNFLFPGLAVAWIITGSIVPEKYKLNADIFSMLLSVPALILAAYPFNMPIVNYVTALQFIVLGLIYLYIAAKYKIESLTWFSFMLFSTSVGYAYYVYFNTVSCLFTQLSILWLIAGVLIPKSHEDDANIFSMLLSLPALAFAAYPFNMPVVNYLTAFKFILIGSIYLYFANKYKFDIFIYAAYAVFNVSAGYFYYLSMHNLNFLFIGLACVWILTSYLAGGSYSKAANLFALIFAIISLPIAVYPVSIYAAIQLAIIGAGYLYLSDRYNINALVYLSLTIFSLSIGYFYFIIFHNLNFLFIIIAYLWFIFGQSFAKYRKQAILFSETESVITLVVAIIPFIEKTNKFLQITPTNYLALSFGIATLHLLYILFCKASRYIYSCGFLYNFSIYFAIWLLKLPLNLNIIIIGFVSTLSSYVWILLAYNTEKLERLKDLSGPILKSIAYFFLAAATASAFASGFKFFPQGSMEIFAGIAFCAVTAIYYFWLAYKEQKEILVYIGEIILGMTYVYLDKADLFHGGIFRNLLLITASIILLWVWDTCKKYKVKTFQRPTFITSLLLPLVSAAIVAFPHVSKDMSQTIAGIDPLLIVFSAAYYTFMALKTEQKELNYLAAFLYNTGIYLLWTQLDLKDMQFYFIPIGLTIIFIAQMHSDRLTKKAMANIRLFGSLIIYAAPTFSIITSGSDLHALCIGIISILSIVAGISFRIKVFLYLGTIFLFMDIAGQVIMLSMSHSLFKWIAILFTGLAIIMFAAYFERKRDMILKKIDDISHELKAWE